MLKTISRLNSRIVMGNASGRLPARFSVLVASRPSLIATIGSRTSRRHAPSQGSTVVTQAVAQETLLIGEAPWHKDLVNCISVIGRLAKPLELRQGSNYQVANGAIAVKTPGTDTNTGEEKPPTWVDIETWGDLALAAAAELRKGEQIQVLGRIKKDEWTGRDGVVRRSMKVTANQINRIVDQPTLYDSNDASVYNSNNAPWDMPQNGNQYDDVDQTVGAPDWGNQATPAPIQEGDDKWTHLIQNMGMYFDNRLNKRSEKGPDFKMKGKDKDVALWLNSAPQWVKDELEKIPAPPPSF